ncbi:DNA cytosine methyltransferase [Parapedobacter sp. ISTM3]|uniref:DNA cytosine methyltransferase n=1 Tax=Parapedobacter sp. ISTM3 TaxID=2800130 RepID=UPI001907FD0C|nr:DNA cytosine methyltransferase [Parapedobacter sp. ISTM3]
MANLRHGSLFSGIGGFDLAASWCGWDNVFHCETNVFCRKVLNHHFPNSRAYENIKDADFGRYRGGIDVLSGGFPCQPFSVAGKRLGTADDRHLWPFMLGAIRQIRPRWIVGENVRGLISWNGGMVFEEVCTELEAAGYEVLPLVLPAAGVDAPHRRERVWVVAHAGEAGQWSVNRGRTASDPDHRKQQEQQERGAENRECPSATWRSDRPRPAGGDSGRHPAERVRQLDAGAGILQNIASDSPRGPAQDQRHERSIVAQTDCSGETRRPEHAPFQDYWKNWPAQPALCAGDDGLPNGMADVTVPVWYRESIHACGNAIVPQVAHRIFRSIQAYETIIKKQ